MKTDFRQEAIDWLNSKNRDLSAGISILKQAEYKPHVTGIFEKNLSRRDIPKKVLTEVRLYIRFCNMPDKQLGIHQDENPDRTDTPLEDIDSELNKEYPEEVKKLLEEYSALYKNRGILHTDLKNVGEQNDEASIKQRKKISLSIDAISKRLETLWKAFKEYQKAGELPDTSLFSESFDPDKVNIDNEDDEKGSNPDEVILPDNPEELNKLKESNRVKLLRAENKLNYQSDKKQEVLNPMPDGPKRILLEKKITELKALKERIELKIAELK
jgi:hypothetical protein